MGRGPRVGPPLAGHISTLCVRLEIPRTTLASLSLTGPQRPDCATPGLSSSAPGPSRTGKGPDGYPQRLSCTRSPPPPSSTSLPAQSCPGAPPSCYCSICLSQPPVPSAPSCVALRTVFCPPSTPPTAGSIADHGCCLVCRQVSSPNQAGDQELVRTPWNPPTPHQGCSRPAVGCRICVAPCPVLV